MSHSLVWVSLFVTRYWLRLFNTNLRDLVFQKAHFQCVFSETLSAFVSVSPLCPWGCVGPVWPWRSCPSRWFWAAGSCRRAAAAAPRSCGNARRSGPSACWSPDGHCCETCAVERKRHVILDESWSLNRCVLWNMCTYQPWLMLTCCDVSTLALQEELLIFIVLHPGGKGSFSSISHRRMINSVFSTEKSEPQNYRKISHRLHNFYFMPSNQEGKYSAIRVFWWSW